MAVSMDIIYRIKDQCDKCKLGQKKIGPNSGCHIKKKLVVDQSTVAWKHKHLFLEDDWTCKMFQQL